MGMTMAAPRRPALVREYRTISRITGPLVFVRHVRRPAFGALVDLRLGDGSTRRGQVIDASEDFCAIQVFEETIGLDVETTRIQFVEDEALAEVSRTALGRVMNGTGRPIDELPPFLPEARVPVAGMPINPWAREDPSEFIQIGISAIDGMNTLVRGQKLPIFSGAGLPANELAAQILTQARVPGSDESFAVVLAGIGITAREAQFFMDTFAASGARDRAALYLNRADDPPIERLLTPRFALALAEHLAFEHGMHVLVVLSDMTNYCEALRQVALARREIPGRRGYPGYMYTDLAMLYERAGRLKHRSGSVTQLPILTMPDDDITHPIPDLTGYVTEGQIVLSRDLHRRGLYPPIDVLPCLSRLMNLGIGAGKTREDHRAVSDQLYAAYARGTDVRRLRDIVGDDALGSLDRTYLQFADAFEERFVSQGHTSRTLEETLTLGWTLLRQLPRSELSRIDAGMQQRYLGDT
jgi:V/A-type H+-transporting ATPase subunit B